MPQILISKAAPRGLDIGRTARSCNGRAEMDVLGAITWPP